MNSTDVIRAFDPEVEPFKSFLTELPKKSRSGDMKKCQQFLLEGVYPTRFKWKFWRDRDQARADRIKEIETEREHAAVARRLKNRKKSKKPLASGSKRSTKQKAQSVMFFFSAF